MEMLWNACIAFVVIYISYCIRWRIKTLKIFKRANIPGPPPSFLFGNIWEIYKHGTLVAQKRWHEQYGPVVGCFVGLLPVVLVSDTDLLRTIMIKDFVKFADRSGIMGSQYGATIFGTVPVAIDSVSDGYVLKRRIIPSIWIQNINHTRISSLMAEIASGEDIGFVPDSILVQKGQRWKESRSTLTPAFTSKKLRKVAPEMCVCVDKFMKNVDKHYKSSTECDIYELYKGLTLDTISRSGMGVDFRVQDDMKSSKLIEQLELLFAFPLNIGHVMFCSSPIFIKFAGKFVIPVSFRLRDSGENPLEAVFHRCAEVVKSRRLHPELARTDVLQLMMDARLDETPKSIDGDVSEAPEAKKVEPVFEKTASTAECPSATKPKGLSEKELLDNTSLLLIAGYETTSASLAFITKMLLRFPEVQEKVRAELLGATEGGKVFEFDRLQRCEYTEAVIQETLRMYPPLHFFAGRVAAEDVEYGSITIPKGMSVFTSTNELHYDEEVFANPKEFRPERWLPGNKTLAMNFSYQPFGVGPRICIGMRFAQMEMKFALARLLTKYRISSKNEPLGEPLMTTLVLLFNQRVKDPLMCDLELL